jgi:phosphate transport system substrate-binding protein
VKFKTVATAGAIVLASTLALSACSSNSSGTSTDAASGSASSAPVDTTLSGTITAGGSSAQANAQAAWTAAFNAQSSGVTINYDKSQGSGGGVTNWLNGSYDFAGTDAGLTSDQYSTTTDAIDVPVYLSGVAIIYNLDGVTDLQLSSATLAKIFELKITKWDDAAIKKENPDATLPSTAITVVTRSDGSGTTANFTTYLKDVQPSIFTQDAGSAWPVSGTSGQQGGSGVVSAVAAGKGTIGYADQSSIGTATAAKIQVGTGTDYVAYSEKGATNAFSAAATTSALGDNDLLQTVDYSKITDTDSYPIPLLSYVVVHTSFKDATQAKLTKAYLSYIVSAQGQAVSAKNAGSAPLPAAILADDLKSIALIK